MDQHPPTLPFRHRVVRSARGLACSTLSGVAGIEQELRDPRASGKQQLTPRRRKDLQAPVEDVSKRRKQRRPAAAGEFSSSSTSSFRSRFRDDGSAICVEQVFDRFSQASDPDFQIYDLPSKAHESSLDVRDRPVSPAPFYRPQTWHLAADQNVVEQVSNEVACNAADSASMDAATQFETQSTQCSRAAARLDQVQHHLHHTTTRALAQNSSTPQPLNHEHPYADHTLRPKVPILSPSPHHHPSHPPPAPQNEEEAEPEEPPQPFHCPYVACHHILAHQTLTLSASEPRRRCVHTGCAFVSVTARRWVEHAWAPHHDLIGFVAVGEEGVEGEGLGGKEREQGVGGEGGLGEV